MLKFFKKRLALFCLLFLFIFILVEVEGIGKGNSQDIQISTTTSDFLEVMPGKIVTIPLKLSNVSVQDKELIEEIELPSNWRLVLPAFPFTLKSGEEDIRLFSFMVSSQALVDEYKVTYYLKNKDKSLLYNQKEFTIKVLPKFKIEIVSEETIPYIVAGEECTINFKIINQSNISRKITLSADDREDYPLELKEKEIFLEVGESKVIEIILKSPEGLSSLKEDRVTLNAYIQDFSGKTISFYKRTKVQIIPLKSGSGERYFNLPSTLSGKYEGGKNVELKISGAGLLTEGGDTKLSYSIQGDNLIFPSLDPFEGDYSLHIENSKGDFYLGGVSFKLNPLIRNSISNSGIGGSWKTGGLTLGGFYSSSEYLSEYDKTGALFISGNPFKDNWELKLNYLNQKFDNGEEREVSDIWGIEIKNEDIFSQSDFPLHTSLYLEYAQGLNNDLSGGLGAAAAWRGRAKGQLDKLNYDFNFIQVDEDYPGGINAMNYQSASFSYPLNERLSLGLNLRNHGNFFDQDLLDSKGISVDYWLYDNKISLLYQNSLLAEETGGDSDLYRLSFRRKEGKTEIRAFYDYQIINSFSEGDRRGNKIYLFATHNPQSNLKFDVFYYKEWGNWSGLEQRENLDFSTQFTFKEKHSLEASWKISQIENKDKNEGEAGNEYSNIELGYKYKLDKGFALELGENLSFCHQNIRETLNFENSIGLSYQHEFPMGLTLELKEEYVSYNQLWGEESNLKHTIGLGYQHKFPNGGTIELKGDYSSLGNNFKDGNISAEISCEIPFGIPLGLRKDIGKVKGRVYDADKEGEPGLEGVIVKLNNLTTITDEEGNYLFQNLEEGEYFLRIDYSSLGEDKITITKIPLKLEVKKQEEIEVDLGICQKAVVKGRVVRFDLPASSLTQEESDWVEKGGVANVWLELEDDQGIMRCFTDAEGYFIFSDIRPGAWSFDIVSIGLPSYHYVKEYSRKIEIGPGEVKDIYIQVLPKKRKIMMIEGGDTTLKIKSD